MNTTKNYCKPLNKNFENILLPTLYILVLIVGLVANGWGLKSLLHNWKKLGDINIFLLNLGLADILYLLNLPLLIVYYLKGRTWIFGETLCKLTRFCFNLNLYCSIGFLTCISVYRYLAIVHPMKSKGRLTANRSIGISAIVWILVSVQSLPDMFFPKKYFDDQCFDTTTNDYMKGYLDYTIIFTFFGFCIPFLITVWSYGHVTYVVCSSKTIDKNVKRRSLKLLAVLILLFLICYVPYHIFKNLNLYLRLLNWQKKCSSWEERIFRARQVTRGLVSLNSALNPLVYLYVNEVMQLLQRGQQMFRCLSPARCRSVPVSQTEKKEEMAMSCSNIL
ncbi:PREDICTED: P2Y purinoceptor 1-like [Cyprinodon variegatus]|uniref:P2Y purinoceptor 1-like n=1 Tax=Cyprinodon variegatus TaxID=28743 RepID=A0A3Q2DUN9_CYPVA|nr:PREDICTED: P2Y purinoceptor 1-like [Cyprinodon variegatus]